MDKNRTLEFYVGIFVFLGFAAMLFMALQAANLGSFTGSGEQYVGLEAGADEENLKNGDEIRRTQSAVVLETLISQFLYNTAEKTGKE